MLFDKYRIWCLSVSSQADSLPTTSIPKTFPNFVILFTLHHSLLAPAPPSSSALPSPQPSLFLVFLLYYRQMSPGLVMQLHPTSHFFPSSSSSSLTVVTQHCYSTSPATAVLILVFAAFGWVPQQNLPATVMSHRKSMMSYSSSRTLPPPFSVFSRI